MSDNHFTEHNKNIALQSVLQMMIPAILTCGIVAYLWRYLQYYVDSDAISYLNITARYVAGDYNHAINAFWSPMGCWMAALLVKWMHLPVLKSAIIVNTIPAVGLVISEQRLFQKFRTAAWERWCFGLMSAAFWSYTVYYQNFTDLWQFFFLTVGVLILLRRDFTSKPLWWIVLGIMGALSFFGKAYSFVFYPIMIFIVSAIKLYDEGRLTFKKLFLISCIGITAMMLCIAPWVYILHEKYNIWTYSTAGKLNMSWYLVGTQEFRPDIKVVVPPPYKGSLFYFEDPFLAQGKFTHFWSSPKLFLKQMIRVGYNIIDWTEAVNRISAFYFIVWILSILFFIRRKQTFFKDSSLKIMVVLFLIFPLPYWLLTFAGGRYLWFTIPLMSIIGLGMSDTFIRSKMNLIWYRFFVAIFFLSFLITPLADLKDMYKAGFPEHEMAEKLQQLNIHGSFIANRSYADKATHMIQLSWFSQNPWYCHTLSNFSTKELLEDAARYQVKYYFYFYDGTGEDFQLRNLKGELLPDLTNNSIDGLKVFQIGEE